MIPRLIIPGCNCGRRGGRREGCCIFCMEKDLNWRIQQQVRQLLADAMRKDGE